MSKHEKSPTSAQSEPDFIREMREPIYPFDSSLESLAAFIDRADTTEIGVTLHVKGAVLSGLLVSSRRFFSLLLRALEQGAETGAGDGGGIRVFADFYRPTLESLEQSQAEYRESDKSPPRPRHVHMRQVVTYLGSTSDPLRHALWRGRLTEVDGWCLGSTEPVLPLPEGVG